MILTGARRNEVSHMRYSEIDTARRLWTIPAERSKNHRACAVPLSAQAWSILHAVPPIAGSDFVFTVDGRVPVNNWGEVKLRLSAKAGIDPASWRLHDLRRSCAAGLQKLGVSIPVIERALNHVSGAFAGIVGTYQVHDYAREIAVALQRWANEVERIAGGDKLAKVVPLRGKRQ